METVILLGAPGAGKGTVAEDIKKHARYIHVSTGEMLRQAVKSSQPVGLEAKSFMDKGELVPDEIIMRIVTDRLEKGAADSKYLFDGFPRTTNQAVLLDRFLAKHGTKVRYVFYLEVPREVLITRISGRRVCRQCGAVYHVQNIPSKVEGVCDSCGGELYQRPDDNEATVVNRLEVYERQTASLIHYYEDQHVLVRVPGKGRQETEDCIRKYLVGA